jgi:site-specific recombinase XerD
LDLTPKEADDFIYDRRASGASATMIRLDVAACSSFFTWMERRHEKAIRNPFRGTKARPSAKTEKPVLIPTTEEAEKISDRLTGEAWLAFQMAWLRGLRVGALPSLTITGQNFKARSNGKDISGEILDPELIARIKSSGLEDLKEPFRNMTETQLADRIRKVTKKMKETGEIAAAYSIHDFRHLYAITEYRKDKDLYRVMGLLNHTSIQTTEIYLKGLGIIGK